MRPVSVFSDYLVKLVIPVSRVITKPAVICRCVPVVAMHRFPAKIESPANHENETSLCIRHKKGIGFVWACWRKDRAGEWDHLPTRSGFNQSPSPVVESRVFIEN